MYVPFEFPSEAAISIFLKTHYKEDSLYGYLINKRIIEAVSAYFHNHSFTSAVGIELHALNLLYDLNDRLALQDSEFKLLKISLIEALGKLRSQ